MFGQCLRGVAVVLAVALSVAVGCSEAQIDRVITLADGFGDDVPADVEPPEGAESLGPETAMRLYYQFVDDRGKVRFVERLADVPDAWKDRVGFVEMSVPPPLTPGDARALRNAQAAASGTVSPGMTSAASRPTVIFYSASWCGWCRKAKAHMDREGIRYELRDVDVPSARQELVAKTGQKGVPAFDVDGRILTGFDPDGLERLVASM